MNYPIIFPNTSKLFFVVGNMRSGTTWLQLLFDHHPEIVCRGEMHALESPEVCGWTTLETLAAHSGGLREWYWRANNCWSKMRVGNRKKDDSYRIGEQLSLDYVRFFFEWTVAQFVERNCVSWPAFIGDRTPAHTRGVWDSIHRFFRPYDPVVFHIVRDPRDVLVSFWYHVRRLQNEGRFDFVPPFHDRADEENCCLFVSDPCCLEKSKFIRKGYEYLARRLIREWIGVNGSILEEGFDFACSRHLIRYEDLKDDVVGVMSEAFRRLGASSDSSTVHTTVDGYEKVVASGASLNLRKGVCGDWKQHLWPEDLALVEPCRDLMDRYGYEW